MDQSLTIQLPCSFEDTVYLVDGYTEKQGKKNVFVEEIFVGKIDCFIITPNGIVADICSEKGEWFESMIFGQDFWLTREEAEKHCDHLVKKYMKTSPDDLRPKQYADRLERVKRFGYELKWIENQTPELCKAAIEDTPYALEFVKEQTPELCSLAVSRCGTTLKFVKEQTPELAVAAVKSTGLALQYVKDSIIKELLPDTDINMLAVKQDGTALKFIKEQTPELCMAAIEQNPYALEFVNEKTPELERRAVELEGFTIQFVSNQTPELCMLAVQKDPDAILFIDDQTPEICLAAAKVNRTALEYIMDQSLAYDIKRKLDKESLENLKIPTEFLRKKRAAVSESTEK